MTRVTEDVEVAVSVQQAYDHWTDFEVFPEFMNAVQEVRREGGTLHWRACAAGHEKTWSAEIVEDVPCKRVAWESVDGARNRGSVTFTEIDEEHARVLLEMEVEPEGAVETLADRAGLVERHVRSDLERFRVFAEEESA